MGAWEIPQANILYRDINILIRPRLPTKGDFDQGEGYLHIGASGGAASRRERMEYCTYLEKQKNKNKRHAQRVGCKVILGSGKFIGAVSEP